DDDPVDRAELLAEPLEDVEDGLVIGHIESGDRHRPLWMGGEDLLAQPLELALPPGGERQVVPPCSKLPGRLGSESGTGSGDERGGHGGLLVHRVFGCPALGKQVLRGYRMRRNRQEELPVPVIGSGPGHLAPPLKEHDPQCRSPSRHRSWSASSSSSWAGTSTSRPRSRFAMRWTVSWRPGTASSSWT